MRFTYILHCCIGGNADLPKYCKTMHLAASLDQSELLGEHLPLKLC